MADRKRRKNYLTVLGPAAPYLSPSGKKIPRLQCRCVCKKVIVIRRDNYRSGGTRSCGCHRGDHSVTHGLSSHPLYKVLYSIKQRVSKSENYAGRGIKLCKKWDNAPEDFVLYVEKHLGAKPTPQHSIDRIDNDGDYKPGNIRWATPAEQNRNKSDNRFITFRGYRAVVTDVVKRYGARGLIAPTVISRLDRGWSTKRALLTPPKK